MSGDDVMEAGVKDRKETNDMSEDFEAAHPKGDTGEDSSGAHPEGYTGENSSAAHPAGGIGEDSSDAHSDGTIGGDSSDARPEDGIGEVSSLIHPEDAEGESSATHQGDDLPEGEGDSEGREDEGTVTDGEDAGEASPETQKTWRERLRARYLEYREKSIAFKVGFSVLSACLSAMVVVVAGLSSGRLFGVTMLRAIVSFFVAGGLMLSLSFLLEKFAIPMYLTRHGELGISWMNEAEEPDDGSDASPDDSSEDEAAGGDIGSDESTREK